MDSSSECFSLPRLLRGHALVGLRGKGRARGYACEYLSVCTLRRNHVSKRFKLVERFHRWLDRSSPVGRLKPPNSMLKRVSDIDDNRRELVFVVAGFGGVGGIIIIMSCVAGQAACCWSGSGGWRGVRGSLLDSRHQRCVKGFRVEMDPAVLDRPARRRHQLFHLLHHQVGKRCHGRGGPERQNRGWVVNGGCDE